MDVPATHSIALETAPTLEQLRSAADWLAHQPHPTPELELLLNLLLQGRLVAQETGDYVAIADRGSDPDRSTPNQIQGVVVARSGNHNVSLASRDRPTTDALLKAIQPRGCFHRIATSHQVKDWLLPMLQPQYQLQRDHHPLVMICTQPPLGGAGRWAVPQDKPALQAYAEAYQAERGSGNVHPHWDDLIQDQQVAVLEQSGHIVAVVKWGATLHHALVLGLFTFPQFRRQGFAHRLLAFLVAEQLKDYPAVKLWVDEDNTAAIALYQRLGFQAIGSCYTAYFAPSCPNNSKGDRACDRP